MALGVGAALISACSQDQIRVYTVKKEIKPDSSLPAAGNDSATASSPRISYDTPQGWTDIGGTGMRAAAFESGPVSITVIPLPGSAGTLLSNINRWRGQVGLDPTNAEDLETEQVSVAGGDAELVDLIGAEQSMTAAILQKDGMQWFFKMMGPVDDVASERPAFDSFLASIAFPSPSSASSADQSTAPRTPPEANNSAPSRPQVGYNTPADWKDIGGGGMRAAAFEANTVSITVIPLPGNAGTLLSNINRWRGQIGLPPTTAEALDSVDVDIAGTTGQIVELVGEDQALTAAVLPREDVQWFFKMMGPVAEVNAQRANFDSFLSSITFP